MTVQRWMERRAEKEVERITATCRRSQAHSQAAPIWGRREMEERVRRVDPVEQRAPTLVGIGAAHGGAPLPFTPASSVGDLLVQRLDALEQEAEEKGGRAAGAGGPLRQGLHDHNATRSLG
jgi:hypothetical protein